MLIGKQHNTKPSALPLRRFKLTTLRLEVGRTRAEDADDCKRRKVSGEKVGTK